MRLTAERLADSILARFWPRWVMGANGLEDAIEQARKKLQRAQHYQRMATRPVRRPKRRRL